MNSLRRIGAFVAAVFLAPIAGIACDNEPAKPAPAASAATTTTLPAPQPAPEPPRPPDILIDSSNVAIGDDRVAAGEPGLLDRITVFVTGRPMVEGRTVDFVAMRNAKPSSVVALVGALQRAKATGARVKTEARDGTTQVLPLAFANGKDVPDCATVAWIAKDAAIDVWPAGGGTAKRMVRGLAGPDMTLGLEAVRKQAMGCSASHVIIGADEGLSWGLIFDLGTSALQAPGARASTAVLTANAVPGRKLVF